MPISLKLDNDLDDRVRNLAERTSRSAQSIIREAVEQYLVRDEAREAFKQEAVESWAAFQKSGRHLSGDEVRAWIRRWGDEASPAAPKCHD